MNRLSGARSGRSQIAVFLLRKIWLSNMGNTTKPPANILELPLSERAEMALKAAFEKAGRVARAFDLA
jgi:hypothetical protein